MRSMVSQDTWNLSHVGEMGRLEWNLVACLDFLHTVADIVDLIVSLVHISSGPPL